jgi:2-furoyl-CoA dehydrogenase FAD binding subunit
MRMARPSLIIDIMRIPGLDQIESVDTAIRIGATVRQRALEQDRELSIRQPLLAAALPWIGHAQTRSRGTVCGSVAHADPSAELPLVLVALNGDIELRSRRRSRRVSAEHFYTGIMSTACEPDEVIEAVRFPIARAGSGYAFQEVGRRHGDFAIAACAAVVGQRTARLAVGGVADSRRHATCRHRRIARSARRSRRSPRTSKHAMTCTPRRNIGDISCAALDGGPSRRRPDAAVECRLIAPSALYPQRT